MNKRTKKLLAMMAAPPRLRRVSGLPPLSYTAKKAGFLTDYRIYGQTSRNLFDETIYNKNVADATPIYVPIYVGNVNYVTCSTTCPKTIIGGSDDRYSRYIFILSGNVNTGAQNDSNGVSDGEPRTIQPSNGYVTICYRKNEGNNVRPWEYETMLNEGSTALPYEPYGESVGDRTGNLFYKKIENANISSRGGVYTDVQYNLWIGKVTAGETYTALNMNLVVGFFTDEPDFGVYTYNNSCIADASLVYTFTVPSGCSYVAIRFFKNEPTIMLNSGSTPLPYEPYGYKVPVTVSNGTDTQTIPIYLPEQIKKVGDEAEYIDYGEQKFVKKFYELTLNFDDMNNNETFPGWSGGTAVVEYCNKIRSLATDNPNSYMPIQYSSISNFTAIFNVSGNNSILYLGNSNIICHTQSELKEIYAGQSITFILKISDTDLDVTLPALPTLAGTNVLSVGTEVQPSLVEVTGRIRPVPTGGGE